MRAGRTAGLILLGLIAQQCKDQRVQPLPVPAPDQEVLSQPQYKLAIQAYEGISSSSSTTPQQKANAWFSLAKIYHGLSLLSGAVLAYKNGLSLDPDQAQYHYLLGLALQELAQPDEAMTHFQNTLELQPGYVPNLLALAEYRLRKTQYPESAALFTKVLELHPNHPLAFAGMASIELEQQKYLAALNWAQKGQALYPDVSRFHYQAALAFRGMGDLQQAENFFQKSQNSQQSLPMEDPYYLPVFEIANRAKELIEQGKTAETNGFFDRAEAFFKEAAAWDPHLVEPIYQLAQLKHRLGKNSEALQLLEPLLQGQPHQPLVFQLSGAIYDSLGQLEQAKGAYDQLVNTDPDTSVFVLEAGDFLRRHHFFSEALALYQQASSRHPAQYQIRMGQVLMLIRNDQSEEALAVLERLLKQPGVPPPFHLLLARLLATVPQPQLRNGARAFAKVEALTELGVNIELLETGAMALAEIGDFDKAIDWQNAAIQLANKSLDRNVARRLNERLALYKQRKKVRIAFAEDDPIFVKPLR